MHTAESPSNLAMTEAVSFGFNLGRDPDSPDASPGGKNEKGDGNLKLPKSVSPLPHLSPHGRQASHVGGMPDVIKDVQPQIVAPDKNIGLGTGLGSQLMKSSMGSTAYTTLHPLEKMKQTQYEIHPQVMRTRKVTRLTDNLSSGAATPRTPKPDEALRDGGEPRGMFRELLLSDLAWATEATGPEELNTVREHRWFFRGAAELADRGRSYCFFVRCLLDMQRNVQCEEEGAALDPRLTKACKLFVSGQCGNGSTCEMYQLLTHFISNAVIFDEWDRYLTTAFADGRANQEAFLVPHLEQVWTRFCRILPTMEEIFDVLDARFVWRHRLPKVGDVVRETMKRRCFSSKAVTNNEMFTQEKCNNETVKNIKRSFGIGM